MRNIQSAEGNCVIFSIAAHYYINVDKRRVDNLPNNEEGWENLVIKTFGDGFLNGVVATKDLASIEATSNCPITLYQLNSKDTPKGGKMKYELMRVQPPTIKITNSNKHVRLLVVDDSEHVVLIKNFNQFMNAMSETLIVSSVEWPIAEAKEAIVNILSPDGNSLEICLLAHMGRLYLPNRTISKSTNGKNRHKLHRNPQTYLNIRQELKEKHKIDITPFNRTITHSDLPKIEKKLDANISG